MSETIRSIKVAEDLYFVPDEESVAIVEEFGITDPDAQRRVFHGFAHALDLAAAAAHRRNAIVWEPAEGLPTHDNA